MSGKAISAKLQHQNLSFHAAITCFNPKTILVSHRLLFSGSDSLLRMSRPHRSYTRMLSDTYPLFAWLTEAKSPLLRHSRPAREEAPCPLFGPTGAPPIMLTVCCTFLVVTLTFHITSASFPSPYPGATASAMQQQRTQDG